jgi:hypothetical protein
MGVFTESEEEYKSWHFYYKNHSHATLECCIRCIIEGIEEPSAEEFKLIKELVKKYGKAAEEETT